MIPIAAIFLPLLGAVVAGFFGRWLGDHGAQRVTCAAMLLAAALSVWLFVDVALGGAPRTQPLFTWISSGSFDVSWSLRLDTLSVVMICVVNIVSSMVHLYSIGYMHHDPAVPRFMAYLSLFTFFMLMLVTADNLVQIFFGWEGVGLASYLLIGFWYHKDTANAAAMKAFVVNRVGDFGFALGIFAIYLLFDTVQFDAIFAAAASKVDASFSFFGMDVPALTTIGVLLFIGAMGKSAQLGLHTWLPDAMEGPTPVSALIHAATMVTAGVFLVARMSPLYEYAPDALAVVAVVGGTTAFFAATVGVTQTDIKRVIAYSTCSQLGYMFFALGVSAYGAAIFHLVTHAFFKALLFLGAGSVIHAMSGEQDIRRMGGIWRLVIVTYVLMWIGSLALAGIPPFAGFFSKDIVLEAAYAAHTAVGTYAFWLGIAAAFLTAFYSWRLLILTFHGTTRADHHTIEHVHESPWTMLVPLFVLAAGAIGSGYLLYDQFVGSARVAFWGASIFVLPGRDTIEAAHHVPGWVPVLPLVVALAGIGCAVLVYLLRPGTADRLAQTAPLLYRISLNKWYFDELYGFLFVRPAMRIGQWFWKSIDIAVIDNGGPNGAAAVTRLVSRLSSRLQTGFVYHYAFVMLIGVFVLISGFLLFDQR